MIYLGINRNSFTVSKSDVDNFYINSRDFGISDRVEYKGFDCIIRSLDKDNVTLAIMTNDPTEHIPIVI